jgi:hypothetical protein
MKLTSPLSKRPSPEIARYNGMVISMYYMRDEPPHIQIENRGQEFRLGIPSVSPISEETPPPGVIHDIKSWFKTSVSYVPKGSAISIKTTVQDLVMEQWRNARNSRPVEKIPTPDEIKKQTHKGKTSSFSDRTKIKSVQTFPGSVLLIEFADGVIKKVDVKAMRGHIPPFKRVFNSPKEFKTARIEPGALVSGKGVNALEIENEDLYAAGVLHSRSSTG